MQAYKDINQRLRRYLEKLNKSLLEEGFTIRERLLIKNTDLQRRYEEHID